MNFDKMLKNKRKMMSAFHDIIASQLAGFLFHTAVMHCLCVSFSQLQGHGWGQLAGMGVCVCVCF